MLSLSVNNRFSLQNNWKSSGFNHLLAIYQTTRLYINYFEVLIEIYTAAYRNIDSTKKTGAKSGS